MLFA
jgi:hypothetical protein